MAEYYEESRNEGPNILGMAGLLGLGALAGAGGYYALRNARGKNAAAEALTRAARNERPRGVQMGDLSSRVTGDFGYDPRITGNTQLPTPRASRVTGDRVTGTPQRPVAPHAPEQYSNIPPSVPPTVPTSTLVDRRVQANYAAIARELGDYPGETWTPPLDPSVSYGNLTRERGETTPSAETRARAYANAAAKSVSELPRVTRPQSGISESMLITDPNTGEIYRRGGGGSYFASKAPAMEAGALLTDLPQVTTAPATGERMVRRHGRMVPLSSIKQKQPAIPTSTVDLNALETPTAPAFNPALLKGRDVDLALNEKGIYLTGNPYEGEIIVNTDKGGSYQLKHPFASHPKESFRQTALAEESFAKDLLARAGITSEQAEEARFAAFERLSGGNPNLQNQATEAVESGAAQQEGRVWQQLSRNEDLDKTQIAQLNAQADADYKAMLGSNPSEWSGVEGDVAINTVAKALPDGLPIDQAEGIGYDLRTGERFKFGGARPARTGLAPGGTIELQAGPGADLSQTSAARFLQQRRLKLLEDASAGTAGRLEKKLAEALGPEAWREDPKATRRRNALKLGAAGNERFFENINEGTINVAGQELPVSALKEGVYMEDTAQNLVDRVNSYKDWLGNIRLEETRNQIGLANELDNLLAQDARLQADVAGLGEARRSFRTPQERDEYLAASRGREVAMDLQDEIDARVNETLRNYEMSERRLAGAEKATARNIQRAAVPQKLMGGVEEGIVVRPVLTAPDNIVVEEGELSNLERGRPVGEYISQEQLEIVPGGLLSGGRARSIPNIGSDRGIDPETGDRITLPNVNEDTGETLVQKLAGKRMGADVSVRGRGGVAGLETLGSIGIYGPELAEYGTAAMNKQGQYTKQARRPPTVTDTSVGVHKIRKYETTEEGKTKPIFFTYPSSYEDPQAYKYSQPVTQKGLQSIDLSRAVQGIYAGDPRDLAEAKVKVGLRGMAQLAGKQLPPSVTSSRFAATGPSTPLTRMSYKGGTVIDEETGQRVAVPPQYISNRPVPPTEEVVVGSLEPTQLSFPSEIVPPIARTRMTEADRYADQLANYMARMQRGQTEATSSPAVIQPNLIAMNEYQLPLALSAGTPTPQIQGPMRAAPQLRGFEAPIQYVETYQPNLFNVPVETPTIQNPVANLTLRERNAQNRLQRIREDVANRQQRRLAGGI
jgi:hypothetical protein